MFHSYELYRNIFEQCKPEDYSDIRAAFSGLMKSLSSDAEAANLSDQYVSQAFKNAVRALNDVEMALFSEI